MKEIARQINDPACIKLDTDNKVFPPYIPELKKALRLYNAVHAIDALTNKKKTTKSQKECGTKILNEKTGRCNKPKRVNKKPRVKSAWDIHLAQVREDNPDVKGKEVMILAKETYYKPATNVKIYDNRKPATNVKIYDNRKPQKSVEFEGLDDSDLDDDAEEIDGDLYLDNRLIKLPENTTKQPEPVVDKYSSIKDEDEERRNNKESNETLADAFESLDSFGKELENVVNSDMMRRDKEEELDSIRDRFTSYNNLLFDNRDNFTAQAFQRKNKAYDYLVESYKLAKNSIKDGEQNIDLQDYGEEQNIERIIEDDLAVEQSPLYDDEYAYLPPAEEDYISDDEELARIYDGPAQRDTRLKINPLYSMVPSISEKIDLDHPYENLYDNAIELDVNREIDTNLFSGSRQNKAVKVSDLTPLINSKPAERKVTEVKPKRKIPLNLKLFQAFQRLMKKNSPELSRKDITDIWKTNKEAYIDMLMEIVEQNGGDLMNEDHYFNAFNNMGGMMCAGGNIFDDAFHSFTGYEAPKEPRRLDSLEDWGDTIADIGKATATGVFNVGKIFNPFSWI